MENRSLAEILDEAARREDAGQPPYDDEMALRLIDGFLRPAVIRHAEHLAKAWRMSKFEAVAEAVQAVWRHLNTPPVEKELGEDVLDGEEQLEPAPTPRAGKAPWRRAQEKGARSHASFLATVGNFLCSATGRRSSWRCINESLRGWARRKDLSSLGFDIIRAPGGKAGSKPEGFRRKGSTLTGPQPLSSQELEAWVKRFETAGFAGFPSAKDCETLLANLFESNWTAPPCQLEALALQDATMLICRVWKLPAYPLQMPEPSAPDEEEPPPMAVEEPGGEADRRKCLETWRAFTLALADGMAETDGEALLFRPPEAGESHYKRWPIGSTFAVFWLWWELPLHGQSEEYVLKDACAWTGIPKSTLEDRKKKVETKLLPSAAKRARFDLQGFKVPGEATLMDYLRHRFKAWKPPQVEWSWEPPEWLVQMEAELDQGRNSGEPPALD